MKWSSVSGREYWAYTRPTKKSPAEMMKGWFDENEMYNYDENSCRPEETCGHYTRVTRLN